MHFISMLRLPDLVAKEDFEWAISEATKKKKQDFSKVEFFPYDEGICVQCMHIGSYDDEPVTVSLMHDYAREHGYKPDITDIRYHHEIYLGDGAIESLSKKGLIALYDDTDSRKKEYLITDQGKEVAKRELKRIEGILVVANEIMGGKNI